jgi:hypothetical protein
MTDTFSFPETLAGGMPPLSGFPTSQPHRRRHVDAASKNLKAAAPGPLLTPNPPTPPPAPAATAALASAAAVSPCCIAVAPRPPAASAAGRRCRRSSQLRSRFAVARCFPPLQLQRRGRRCRPPAAGGAKGGAAASTPERETAPEPSDDEAASFITQDREGGTDDNNRGPSPSLTLETMPSKARA